MTEARLRLLTVGSMYPPHHQGGYELMWQAFVRHAREAGHEVVVLASDHREPSGADHADEPDVHRELPWWWVDHGFPRRSLAGRLAVQRGARRVFDRYVQERPDVVLWWSMGGMVLDVVRRARRAGLRSVGVVHDAWPAYGPTVDQSLPRRRFDPRDVDVWSANSAWVRDGLLRLGGWEAVGDRLRVDRPGIDPQRVPPAPPRDWRWRLLCVGRVEERKGLEDAVRALAALPEPATLDVVGTGDAAHAGALQALARDLGVGARLRLRGRVDDVAAAYADADVVLFPVTWDEPFGLVPLESMSVGRPVVATATGGAREYLGHERNALVVPPRDPPALAAAIRRLADDPALRARLRDRGAETAATLTQRRFTGALLDVVGEVAGVSSPA